MAKKVETTSPSALSVIDGKISSIKKRGMELKKDCHECLVMIMDHYIAHGDFTRLMENGDNNLVSAVKTALGNSVAQALVQWVHEFVPSLRWNDTLRKFENVKGVKKEIKDVENYVLKSSDNSVGVNRTFTGNARDLAFYELERPTNIQPFDFMKGLQQFITRAEKARDEALKNGKEAPVNRAQIDALKGLAENIGKYKDEPEEVQQEVAPEPAAVAA